MRLQKLGHGIRCLGKPDYSIAQAPLGLVHPYFCVGYSDPNTHRRAHYFGGSPEEYLKGLESLITEHEGPVIVWEEEELLKGTAKHIAKLGRSRDTYFISTAPSDPRPAKGDWEDVVKFLARFEGAPFQMGGGYFQPPKAKNIMLNRWNDAGGCLGYTLKQIEDKIEFTVIKDITFAFNEPST